MATSIALVATTFIEIDVLERLDNATFGEDLMKEAERSDSMNQLVALINLMVRVISAVFFIQWFRRAYHNITNFTTTEFTDGWAAGAWFVPFINLARPLSIMRELWVSITNHLGSDEFNSKKFNYMFYTGAWWALWIISKVISNIAIRLDQDTISDIILADNITIIAALLEIPLAIVTVKIIKEYNNREETLG
jgi:hypothetical protein